MNFFWDHYQQRQIRELRGSARRNRSKSKTQASDLKRVIERTDRLALINQALWELLSERNGLQEEDLVAKVREIDLRDGVEDGKVKSVNKCPDCERVMSRRHKRCLYCGKESLTVTPFDGLWGDS